MSASFIPGKMVNQSNVAASNAQIVKESPSDFATETSEKAATRVDPPVGASCLNLQIDLGDLSLPPPPDGEWGWFIVLGSFLCMVLIDGVCFSYGIFLSELEETFGASKTLMTLAGSLLTGVYFIMGPLVSGLMNSFSPRVLMAVGTLISSVCIFASSFATNVYLFIGLFGVCGGIGFGMVYLPAATMVTTWFLKKRATTTGIIMAGSGVGATVYSFVIPHLITAYTWRGCVMLLAGVNLNSAVAAALFRSRRAEHRRQQVNQLKKIQPILDDKDKMSSNPLKSGSSNRMTESLITVAQQATIEGKVNKKRSTGFREVGMLQKPPYRSSVYSSDEVIITHANQLVPVRRPSRLDENVEALAMRKRSVERLPVISLEAVNLIADRVLTRKLSQQPFGSIISNFPTSTVAVGPVGMGMGMSSSVSASHHYLASTHELNGQFLTVQPSDTAVIYSKVDLTTGGTSYFTSNISLTADVQSSLLNDGAFREAIIKELHKEVDRPVHKKDLFLSGSVIHLDRVVSQDDPGAYLNAVTRTGAEEQVHSSPVMNMLRNLFHCSIFNSHTFILITISSVFTMIGYLVPYQFLKDNAQTYGFNAQQSAYLIAYMGIANTVGRIASGWLSDQKWANVIYLNNVSLIISGGITMMVPVMKTYPALVTYAVAYGFVIAAFVGVRTVLIVEVLGLDRLTNAFGFMLLFQGVTVVLAPPLLGLFYDKYQNFGVTFMFGGLAIVISGFLCLPLATLSKWEERRRQSPGGDADEPQSGDVNVNSTGQMPSASGFLRRVRDWMQTR